MAVTTMGLAEAKANFSKVAAEVNRTGRPVTLLKNNRPWVVIAPVDPSALDVAVDFMDEYSDVFEELAK
ncbi:type II toxin-antitoxin system Phd/YefM family antitoxin [Thermophilibacter mediterraneus]|uniref:type II toxin-antitoxin system Phd/YefM family antitoxin n=1 Tax=Thermophilibacter mediterraneus TaxID=1871031 RepID=UPI002357652D|nr:type II toxin-antitoxin system prevent-host-death family antitoxin [Thermophilibacter mediterraneus]